MRTITVPNFATVDMIVKTANLVFKESADNLVSISGLTSWTHNATSGTEGSIVIRGNEGVFNTLVKAPTVDLYIEVGGVEELYSKAYMSHPMNYDTLTGEIEFQVSTLPPNTQFGYTDYLGRGLPHAFGKPWVNAVKITHKDYGAILSDKATIPMGLVVSFFNAVAECLPAMSPLGVVGTLAPKSISVTQARPSTLMEIAAEMYDRAPEKLVYIEKLMDILDWRARDFTDEISRTTDSEGNVSKVLSDQGGYMPPWSFSNLFNNVTPSPDRTYTNASTGVTLSQYSLFSYYRALILELTEDITELDLDWGNYTGPLDLKMGGRNVTGDYANKKLTNLSFPSDPIPGTLNAGASNFIYELSTDAFILGKYLRVSAYIPYHITGMSNKVVWVCQVLKQVGQSVILSTAPYWVGVDRNTGAVEFANYKKGAIGSNSFLTSNLTIEYMSDSLHPSILSNITYLSGRAIKFTDSVERTEVSSSNGSLKEYAQTIKAVKATVNLTAYGAAASAVTFALESDTSKGYYSVGTPGSHDGSWQVTSGDAIELNHPYTDIYIVNDVENTTVLSVKAQRFGLWAEVPSDYYEVDGSFHITDLDISVTVIKIIVPLSKRQEGWTDELKIQVDAGTDSLEQLAELATSLERTTEHNIVDFKPETNFVTYGAQDSLQWLKTLAQQLMIGFHFTENTVKLTQLNIAPELVVTITADMIETQQIRTTDTLDIHKRATYTWQGLDEDQSIDLMEKESVSIAQHASVSAECYDIPKYAIEFAEWHFNRNARNWRIVDITGFLDTISLEPFDGVTITTIRDEGQAEKTNEGVVLHSSYDYNTCRTSFTVLLGFDYEGTLSKPWQRYTDALIRRDFTSSDPAGHYGYDIGVPTAAHNRDLLNEIRNNKTEIGKFWGGISGSNQ